MSVFIQSSVRPLAAVSLVHHIYDQSAHFQQITVILDFVKQQYRSCILTVKISIGFNCNGEQGDRCLQKLQVSFCSAQHFFACISYVFPMYS